MYTSKKQNKFTFWKRPWQKWLTLALAIWQLYSLWTSIRDYNLFFNPDLFNSPPVFSPSPSFSPAAWELFSIQLLLDCVLNGIFAALLFGCFLIGVCAKSRRAVYLSGSLLFGISFFTWTIAGVVLQVFFHSGHMVFWYWLFFVLLLLGGAVYSLWKYLKYRKA